jgi:hypothetical protein
VRGSAAVDGMHQPATLSAMASGRVSCGRVYGMRAKVVLGAYMCARSVLDACGARRVRVQARRSRVRKVRAVTVGERPSVPAQEQSPQEHVVHHAYRAVANEEHPSATERRFDVLEREALAGGARG